MTQRFAIFAALIGLLLPSTVLQAADIQISLIGAQPNSTVHAELFQLPKQNWDGALKRLITTDEVRFADMPAGQYAIRVFVDRNENGQLDTGRWDIPQEPVGFSSNPSLINGVPEPASASFVHGEENTVVIIRLRQDRRRHHEQ